jgi:integrase
MLDINTECYLNALRGFLKSWSELGYPGIDNGVIQQLRKMRLKRRPRPLPSPLSEVDQVNFENKLHAAYEDRTINTRQYVLAWIGLTFAPRACQIASMKIKDLIVDTLSDGKLKYTLKVPRAKQRHQESSRDEFTDREPHEAGLGPLLSAWVKMVIDEFLNTVAEVSFDMQELPLFPKWSAKINEPGMKFHSDSRSIKSELITLAKKLKVQSIETGMNVNISWSILRDTLATRLVEEGKSLVQIALWLDHSGTRNVLHYASLTTKFRKKLDERLVFELAPIAQAFMGVIISDKSETQYDENRNTRLRNPEGDPDLGDVGICGKYGFCSGTMAPISCYTCSQFRAWRHGPHKEVLRLLIARREQLLANTNGDDRVSDSLNHVILAVGQVVMKCDEMPGRS